MADNTIRADTARRHRHKYANKNPLHQFALGRFHDAMAAEIKRVGAETVLDFGCGEGFLLDKMSERGVDLSGYVGIDLRADALDFARRRHAEATFVQADIFEWPTDARNFDLVIASEVLEHLPEPEAALRRLVELCSGQLLLTVPHEPWFRLLNLMRGRDIMRLGNHPEHVQQWNPRTFARMVEACATVRSVRSVFPFILVGAAPPA